MNARKLRDRHDQRIGRLRNHREFRRALEPQVLRPPTREEPSREQMAARGHQLNALCQGLGSSSPAWASVMPTASGPADIVGAILARTPRIRLHLGSPAFSLDDVVVDTGFAGALRVPKGFFQQHGIRWSIIAEVFLADGSEEHPPARSWA